MTLFALQSLVGVVDFIFVASLGTQAVAGVGVATQIQFLSFGLLEAVTTGTVALIAREMGKGRPDEAARVLRTSLGLAAVLGALLMLAIPASDRFVGWMGVAPEVVSLGGRCLRILLAFSIPVGGRRDARDGAARRGRRAHAARDRNRHQSRQRGRLLGADLRALRRARAGRRGLRLGRGTLVPGGRADAALALAARKPAAAGGSLAGTRRAGTRAAPAAHRDSDRDRARRVPARAPALPPHRRRLRDGADLGVPDRRADPRLLLRAGLRLRERGGHAGRSESRSRTARRGGALGLARDGRRRAGDEQRRARDHPARDAARAAPSAPSAQRRFGSR